MILISEFTELYAKGMSGEMKIHDLALAMLKLDVNLIPKSVGDRLNRDMTKKLIEAND